MKHSFLLFSLLFISPTLLARQKVVYGKDDRVEARDYRDQRFVEFARSTAGMVSMYQIRASNTSSADVLVAGSPLVNSGICSYEKFALQYSGPNCTGFLVGPDLLVTAGHCIQNDNDCKSNRWVFDYRQENTDSRQGGVVVSKESVYECKSVISHQLDPQTMSDYTLVKLSRSVVKRKPLKFRSSQSAPLKVGDSLVVIGHPSGLPLKITDSAKVRSISKIYFVSDTDTYGGNSGSPVFNERSGEVEGILVRGENDFQYDSINDCRYSNILGQNTGRGEESTLINNVVGLP